MERGTIRRDGSLALALALAAVTLHPVSSIHPVEAQDIRTPAPAPSRPAPVVDLQSAVVQTAAIARGTVTDIQYDYSETEGPWTRVTLSNVLSLAGDAPPTIEIRQFGGLLPNGALIVAAELPVFVLDKEYIVFLRNTEWNVSPVVGDLALRVERVDDAEVVVNSDGQPVTRIGAGGFEFGPTLFEPFDINGTAPKAIADSLRNSGIRALDRERLTLSLQSAMSAQALRVAGTFSPKPAGGFTWRAQPVLRPPQDTTPIDPTDSREPQADAEPKN
jgi:hypothetical protein